MILAIKTADFTATLVLLDLAGMELHETTWESGRELSAQILARVQKLLRQAKVRVSDLTGIIVFSGPGSFTSLRIGHSVANALSDSLGVPVVGSRGDQWRDEGLSALKASTPGRPALPFYGTEAHITKPRS
jgi:tRNA threonylcarbamoyladenosine biosynthesis protein TsaB